MSTISSFKLKEFSKQNIHRYLVFQFWRCEFTQNVTNPWSAGLCFSKQGRTVQSIMVVSTSLFLGAFKEILTCSSYNATGTWSIASKRGNTLYISGKDPQESRGDTRSLLRNIACTGLRGICPVTKKLVSIDGLDNHTGPARESPAYPRILKSNSFMLATDTHLNNGF
jgi:hypothetical protein